MCLLCVKKKFFLATLWHHKNFLTIIIWRCIMLKSHKTFLKNKNLQKMIILVDFLSFFAKISKKNFFKNFKNFLCLMVANTNILKKLTPHIGVVKVLLLWYIKHSRTYFFNDFPKSKKNPICSVKRN